MMAFSCRVWFCDVIPAKPRLNFEQASRLNFQVPLPVDGNSLLPPAKLNQHPDRLLPRQPGSARGRPAVE